MVNLSQPISFQTAAMAALDAVESRAMSRANSGQQQTSADERRGQAGLGAASSQKKGREKVVDDESDGFELDDEGA